jgi:c-di-GMP-binding flagellar brake protein YcgR
MDTNRRDHSRIKASVPVELRPEGSTFPIRAATSDLSLDGCYIEMMFTLPVGTKLEVRLQVNGTLLLLATVVTHDPHVGNGIKFTKMLAEDRAELQSYIEALEKASQAESNE